MVFSVRNSDVNSNFNFNNIQIDPVTSYGHLGVYLFQIANGLFILTKLLKKRQNN